MTTNENIKTEIVQDGNCNDFTRDDIRIKRRNRRHEKKLEKQSQKAKQQILATDILQLNHSDKIKIICNNDLQYYHNQILKNDSAKKKLNIKHGKYFNTKSIKEFNLLDFANKISHRQIKKINKPVFPNYYSRRLQINMKSGKRREDGVKRTKSKLKKLIIKNRVLKKSGLQDINIKYESASSKNAEHVQTETLENIKTLNENRNIQLGSLEIDALSSSVKKLIIKEETNNEMEYNENSMQKNQLFHSRRFREYCDNLTSPNLCKLTEDLIRELFRFQKNAYEKNKIKARAHKRYVFGFRETRNNLLANKLKLVIIAPDIEPCSIQGGLDDTINEIKLKCSENNIPYLFSLKKRQLAYCCFKKAPISCMGILFYDGAQDIYFKLVECLKIQKEEYLKQTVK